MALTNMSALLSKLKRYYKIYGIIGIIKLFLQRIPNYFIKAKYLFKVDLIRNDFFYDDTELYAESYNAMSDITHQDLVRLESLMGIGQVIPFLKHFFGYGAILWFAKSKIDETIIGIMWTIKGGFSGFYCLPIRKDEIVTLAVQVFHQYKGMGFFAKFNSAVLFKLRQEGIKTVYTGVHCRNKSMLRAVEKANLEFVGRVFTFKIIGYHFSIWNSKYLWRKEQY